jgi:hypothetical protein
MQPEGERLEQMATQYEHVKQVTETAFRLKKRLVEKNLPDTIFAYQLGTGFPLPEENVSCKKVDHIPYEEKNGILRFSRRPGVAGHGDDSGIHVYEITSPAGNKSTLLAIKGREHGYEKVDTYMPHLSLAKMTRVLKGIGTQMIMTTFASGVDTVNLGEAKYKVGDYAVVIGSDDVSGQRSYQDPAVGNQDIIGSIFGGPFLSDANRRPHKKWVEMYRNAVKNASADKTGIDGTPAVHPAYLFDCLSLPHFEGPAAQALPRIVSEYMTRNSTYPSELVASFSTPDVQPFATVHGMSTTSELTADYQSWPASWGAINSPFNRVLPALPVVAFTDSVDPTGGSQAVSHFKVLEQGAKSAKFISPVITDFFVNLTNENMFDSLYAEAENVRTRFEESLNADPQNIDDMRRNLEAEINYTSEVAQLYHLWGYQDSSQLFDNESTRLNHLLNILNISESREDYDYYAGLYQRSKEQLQIIADEIEDRKKQQEDYDDLDRDIQWYTRESHRTYKTAEIIAKGKPITFDLT